MALVKGTGDEPAPPPQGGSVDAMYQDAVTQAAQNPSPESGPPPGQYQRDQALRMLVTRATNPMVVQQSEEQRIHLGVGTSPLQREDPTSLLLHSVGFTGSSVGEFNQAVAQVNAEFVKAYGHPPTPGLVLDIIKSPLAHSTQGLQDLFSGNLSEVTSPKEQAKQNQLLISQSFVESLKTGQDFLTKTVGSIRSREMADNTMSQFADGQNPDAIAVQQTLPVNAEGAVNIAAVGKSLGYLGVGYDTLSGSFAQNVKRIEATQGKVVNDPSMLMGGSFGEIGKAVRGLKLSRDVQTSLIQQYGLTDVKATGAWVGKWPTVIKNLQSTQSYQLTNVLVQAQDAGFGANAFDPYAAVDIKTGTFANNSEGDRARDELKRWQEAIAGKKKAADGGGFGLGFGQIIPTGAFAHTLMNALPIGAFDKGGIGVSSISSWLSGGSNDGFSDDGSLLGHILDIPAIGEQSFIRTTELSYGTMNGAWQQGKVDTFAARAIMSNGGTMKQNWAKAGARLASDNTPTWFDIAVNSPHGQQILAKYARKAGLPPGAANDAAVIANFGTDMAIDFWLAKKISPEALAGMTGGKAISEGESIMEKYALATRNPAVRDGIDGAWKELEKGGEGRAHYAARKLDAPNNDVLYEPAYVPDGSGGVRYVGRDHEMPELPQGTPLAPGEPAPEDDIFAEDPMGQLVIRTGERQAAIAKEAGVEAGPKKMSLVEAHRDGLLTKDTFHDHIIDAAISRRQAFHGIWWNTLPTRATSLFDPVEGWQDALKRPYTMIPHPFRAGRYQLVQRVGSVFDTADSMFTNSTKLGMAGKPGSHLASTIREMFTRAANPSDLPIDLYDPRNINRLARQAGSSNEEAGYLERTFSEGRAERDHAKIEQVRARIEQMYKDNKGLRMDSGENAAEKHYGAILDEEGNPAYQKPLDTVERAAREAKTPEESDEFLKLLEKHTTAAKGEPGFLGSTPVPAFDTEMAATFGMPIVKGGSRVKDGSILGTLDRVNEWANRLGGVGRRLYLTTDTELPFKHGLTDTLRREVGMGTGLYNRKGLRDARALMDEYKAGNPEARGIHDSVSSLVKDTEKHYNNEIKQLNKTNAAATAQPFWLRDAIDKAREGGYLGGRLGKDMHDLHSAAAYIDRRLGSGAYQAWKDGGAQGVEDWFTTHPKGMQLAREEELPSIVLARMVSQNLDQIANTDPSFMEDVMKIRNEAKPGNARSAIAKWILKEDRGNVPVTGHVTNEALQRGPLQFADDITGRLVGDVYMKPNKMNRVKMFNDVTAMTFKRFVEDGVKEEDAFKASLSIGKRVTSYHMFELADALRVEQKFRWASYFFTKHRLYWTWINRTMWNKPELMTLFSHAQSALDTHNGNITIDVPGTGGTDKYVIPIARLLWMNTAAAQPGQFAEAAHNFNAGHFIDMVPFSQNTKIQLTTADSAIKFGVLKFMHSIGRVQSSSDVDSWLNPSERYYFNQMYMRIHASAVAHHDHLTDAQITSMALMHNWANTSMRQFALGGYFKNGALNNKQQALLQKFHAAVDPAKRDALLKAHPELGDYLGLYNATSPSDNVKNNKYWDQFNTLIEQYHAKQDGALAMYRQTGNPNDLFGADYKKIGVWYQKQYATLLKNAKTDAPSWYAQMKGDKIAGLTSQYAGEIHRMFPALSTGQVTSIVKQGKVPAQVQKEQNALDSTLSDDAIAKLPASAQDAAKTLRAQYEDDVNKFYGPASTTASTVRSSYYSNTYGPLLDKYYGFTSKTKMGSILDKNKMYYQYTVARNYADANDHDVKINGVKLPSPWRVQWASYAPEIRQKQLAYFGTYRWDYLTGFQKELLGVKVHPDVQKGWALYNKVLFQGQEAYAKQGHELILDITAQLQLAQAVNDGTPANAAGPATAAHPGFMKDFARTLVPVFARPGTVQAFGATPQARKTWKRFFNEVASTATQYAGAVPSDPVALAAYDEKFRKATFQAAALPVASKGGQFWKWAMQQSDPTFKQEFSENMTANPKFVLDLFGQGG